MATPAQKLKHANGTEVTAQEAYDAFMNTRVLIVNNGITYEAISMEWYDTNSTKADPTNVGFVKLHFMYGDSGSGSIHFAEVGDKSLVPTQQG